MTASSRPRFAPGESPFRIKGVVYRNSLDFADERIRGGRAALLAELRDPKLHAFFAGQTFLAGSFYDALPAVPMCAAGATLLGLSADDYVRELTRYAAERDTSGIYRMLLRLVSPSRVMERTPAAARQYFNFVEAEVEKLGARSYRTRARGIPEFLARFYMVVSETYWRHAIALAGARNVLHEWRLPVLDGEREGVPLVRLEREMSWD
jgi:hypothetical protein